MPQRFLRPAIRQSKRWNRLPYFAQSFYIRLLTLADDYGRYDADPELLRSECFPFGDPDGKPIEIANICEHLTTFVSKGLLQLFQFQDEGGTPKLFLQLLRWQERARTDSKWPDPKKCVLLTNANICEQLLRPSPSPSPSPSPVQQQGDLSGVVVPECLKTVQFLDLWAQWQKFRRENFKKVKDWDALWQSQLSFLESQGVTDAIQILSNSLRNTWQGLFKLKPNENRYSAGKSNPRNNNANAGHEQDYAGVGQVTRVGIPDPKGPPA